MIDHLRCHREDLRCASTFELVRGAKVPGGEVRHPRRRGGESVLEYYKFAQDISGTYMIKN
jgi:hypothetical protein